MSDDYLYVTKCIYPNLLADKIKTLPEKEKFLHCRAASLIHVLSHNKDHFDRANIGRTVWKKTLGSNYRRIINNLLDLGIIAVQLSKDGKESYSNSENNSFCKCYRLTNEAISSGFIAKDFQTAKPHLRLDDEKTTSSLDDIQIYLKNVLNYQITIQYLNNTNSLNTSLRVEPLPFLSHMCPKLEGRIELGDLVAETKGHDWLKRLATNDFEITYGERGGRLYHPIICMPETARRLVWFKNSDAVFDNDVKTAFPVFLLKFVHPDEKDRYKTVLDNDIYDLMAEGRDRKECKKEFNKFINGNVSNYVKDWFWAQFPLTAAWIETNHTTMAARLQKTESDLMVQKVGAFVIKNKIPNWISCHDGWLIDNESANQAIMDFVKNEIEKDCGYCPKIDVVTRTRQII